MLSERTSVGLDVHARSVVAAAIDNETGEVSRAVLAPAHDRVVGWIQTLPGPVAVASRPGRRGLVWLALCRPGASSVWWRRRRRSFGRPETG